MKKITSLTLVAALVPTLMIGSATVYAQDDGMGTDDGMTQDDGMDTEDPMTQDDGMGTDDGLTQDDGTSTDDPLAQNDSMDTEDPLAQSDTEDPMAQSDSEDPLAQSDTQDPMAQDQQASGQETHLTTLPSQGFFADELMGSMVRSTSDDSEVGTVSDVILGDEGEIVAVIVTTGGVMGLGEREVSIAWDEIQRTGEGEEIELSVDMTNDELQDAPEFARN